MEKVIEVKDLFFGYSDEIILENVNFYVEKGDFIGIIGPNGSGKSTLIKLLLKILNPIRGEIKILGERIEKFDKWYKLGYISQKANSFNTAFPATVEEIVGANLFSKVGLFKPLNKQHKEQINHALELVGMQDYKNKLIGNLSGGQQQRVFIARVLVSQPEVMFLDEPTVGVDVKSEEVLYCLLGKLNKELGITILMISHDISAVTVHANKLACMGNRELLMHESHQDITPKFITDLYGHDVKLHVHKHNCEDCCRKEQK